MKPHYTTTHTYTRTSSLTSNTYLALRRNTSSNISLPTTKHTVCTLLLKNLSTHPDKRHRGQNTATHYLTHTWGTTPNLSVIDASGTTIWRNVVRSTPVHKTSFLLTTTTTSSLSPESKYYIPIKKIHLRFGMPLFKTREQPHISQAPPTGTRECNIASGSTAMNNADHRASSFTDVLHQDVMNKDTIDQLVQSRSLLASDPIIKPPVPLPVHRCVKSKLPYVHFTCFEIFAFKDLMISHQIKNALSPFSLFWEYFNFQDIRIIPKSCASYFRAAILSITPWQLQKRNINTRITNLWFRT